ncbi:MAG: hypothetical protein R3B09_03435 [Nannocystaceae bacterium]
MVGKGRRAGATMIFTLGVVAGACVKDNPAWQASASEATEGSTSGSESASASIGSTSTLGTTSSESSAGTDSGVITDGSGSSTSDSTTDATTVATDVTTLATDVTTDATDATTDATTSDTTGEPPPPVCGEGAFGEATMLVKRTTGGNIQDCSDLSGRFYVPLGPEGDLIKAVACSTDSNIGCFQCSDADVLYFNVSTPVPDGKLLTAPCFYLAAFDGDVYDPNSGVCRYNQLALWHNGTFAPLTTPPKVILGHSTASVVPTVTALHGGVLKVVPKPLDAPCSCVDEDDCCPDKAANYALAFSADSEAALVPGGEGMISYAKELYTAYNGNSQEPGYCDQAQQLDWWMLR